jgi:outer membrane protein assembly factor BamB
LRPACLKPETLEIVCDLFWNRYAALLPFQLGGLEMAAVPLVVALVLTARRRGLSVNGFILRKQRKPTGPGKIIEGVIGPEPIIIIDDILNSAGSAEKVRVVLDALGRRIDRLFVIIDYQSVVGRAWQETHGLNAESLFTLSEFGLSLGGPSTAPAAATAHVIWNFRSEPANHFHVVPKSGPVIVGDRVVFGSDRGTLWALDISTGEVAWSFQIVEPARKGIWSRAAAAQGRIYFGGYDGNLYCLDGATGREIWRHSAADWIGSSAVLSVRDGMLWIGLEHDRPGFHGSLGAFSLHGGEKIWEHFLPAYVHSSPCLSPDGRSVAVGDNAHTGEGLWRLKTQRPIQGTPVFDPVRDLVYVNSRDGALRAVDRQSGDLVWMIKTGNDLFSSPLLHKNQIFVTGQDKYLHIIDIEDNSYRKIMIGCKICCTPMAINNNIYFGANDGIIYQFSPETDNLTRLYQTPDPVTSSLAWSEDHETFFTLTYMNQLFAFQVKTKT